MMPEVKAKLDEACVLAVKLMVEITLESGIVIEGGCYTLDDKQQPLHCTPLEAIVLGEESSGDFDKDVSQKLGVSPDFVAGFRMGQNYRFSLRKCGQKSP